MSEEVLSDLERQSAVWLKIKGHLEKRLSAQRTRNDSDLAPEATAKTRGRIAELKELLKLGEEQQKLLAETFVD